MRREVVSVVHGMGLVLAMTLCPAWALAQDAAARVTGRVTASESGLPVASAHVSVQGTGIATVTDLLGRYALARVPAGSHTLMVVYVGRTPLVRAIQVPASGTANSDFVLQPLSLAPVTVKASAQRSALNRQWNSLNIRSVVAADQIARFPDASAPEALQRLPGIALQRDQGEGRYVQIRGSSAATTQVTVNGEQIGSPEADSRQIALDAIPVGVLAGVEVSKAITPDMDADAVGGSVNLITRRADAGRTFTLEGSGGYASLRESGAGTAALTIGNRNAAGNLGWLFSGSFGERNFGSDDIEPDYDDADLAELEVRHYTLWRRRTGFTGAVDIEASPVSRFFLSGLWSELQDHEQRRLLGQFIDDGELVYEHKNRLEKLGTFNVLATAQHFLPGGVTLDYRVSVTRSQEDTPFDHEITFLQEDVEFSPTRANPEAPQTNPLNNALGGTYLFDKFTTGGTLTTNRDLVGGLNISFPFALGGLGSGSVKLGGKIRDKTKDQMVDAFELELDDDASDIRLGEDLGRAFSNPGFNPGTYRMPFTTTAREITSFESRFGSSLAGREADPEEQTNAFDLRERVFAGYAMAELNPSGTLMLLPGVRFEQTTLNTDGNAFDADEEAVAPVRGRNEYSNIFPMLHVRYRLSPSTNLRAAYTSTIFRPNFFDLVPYVVKDGDDVELGNPDLEPVTVQNFDVMVESYTSDIGLLSAGLFYKRLDKPIFSHTFDNSSDGETTQPVNAESGTIIGLEVALQRRLAFLPGPLAGFTLFANYTWTDSRATQPTGRETRIAGQAAHAYNVSLGYESGRFSGQVSLNTVGNYIDELGSDAEDDLFADSRSQVDLSLSYHVTPRAQIFLDGLNLTNEPYRTYTFRRDRLRQLEFYESTLQLGFRVSPWSR